jgi:uncharacterized protein YegP (UPF0339 family)
MPLRSVPPGRLRVVAGCTGRPTRGQQQGGNRVAAKFELKKTSSGQYRFNLKAGNGEIIATSENYTTKSSALNGIESVKKNAAGAAVDDQT